MAPWLFRAGAALMLIAALFHVAALSVPAFARVAYSSTYPVWRHVAFIVITTAFAWLFFRRSDWLLWLFALLTLQIYNGHGRQAIQRWTNEGRVGLIDIVTVIGATVILLLLAVDRWGKRASSRAPAQ